MTTTNLSMDPSLAEATFNVTVGGLSYNVTPADAWLSAPSDQNEWIIYDVSYVMYEFL